MDTERKSNRYNKIETWDTKEVLDAIIESQLIAVSAVGKLTHEIEEAITKCLPLLAHEGRLIFVGSGTSGRIAAQECAELYPTFSWPKNKSLFLLAGGLKALSEAVENVEDDISLGELEMKKLRPTNKDIIICLAASGRTPYTLGALRTANLAGSTTIGISSSANSPLLNEAKIKFFINTGAEIITGSTRMKAGTAQKVILNMFTTTLMIRLNRTYNSYMIDLVASNEKLLKRSIDMVTAICNVTKEEAKEALNKCRGKVKLTCVYLKYNNIKTAEKVLKDNNGDLRKCLEKK